MLSNGRPANVENASKQNGDADDLVAVDRQQNLLTGSLRQPARQILDDLGRKPTPGDMRQPRILVENRDQSGAMLGSVKIRIHHRN